VDGGDDLLGVDPLQLDRGRAEVRVSELALDDVQRHALARELDGLSVTELVWRNAASHAGLHGEPRNSTRTPRPAKGARASGHR
jgi:hypothetical protein